MHRNTIAKLELKACQQTRGAGEMTVLELFSLKGKTAIVTGGGRGLGAQIAQGFAEAGANVVLCSRKVEACEEVAAGLEKLGVQALALACDVTKPEDIANVVAQTITTFGRIDILVNNSGASWGTPAIDMPYEAWQKVFDVNVNGTFLFSQAVGKIMLEQKSGKIINIASIAGLGGTLPAFMDTIAYNASKGAVITLTKDLAVKWGHMESMSTLLHQVFPTKMSNVLIERGQDYLMGVTPLKQAPKMI